MTRELKHYGVLGMKWGRRRAERRAASLERGGAQLRILGFKKAADKAHKKAEIEKAKANELNRQIKAKQKERLKNNLVKARKQAKETNLLIDDLMKEESLLAKNRGKKFNAKESRDFWNDVFRGDTKISDIRKRKNRLTKAQEIVEDVIVTFGDIVLLD